MKISEFSSLGARDDASVVPVVSSGANYKQTVSVLLAGYATTAYVDAATVGLWDDRGNFDASVNAYPSSGGSGSAGAILKGDIWRVSVSGTLPTGVAVEPNDTVRALTDTPGNTQANWAVSKNNAQTSVSGNAGTATALQTARTIDGVSFDGTANITVIAPATHAATGKTTPVDADEMPVADSAASFVLKKLTWANLKATLKTYFDTLYGSGSGSVTSVDASGGVQTVAGSAITTTGTIRGAHVINTQTGPTYAIVSGDRGKHLTLSNASPIAVSIAQAGTTGFEDGYFTVIENIGVGPATITPTTSTVNGASTLILNGGMSAVLFSDGTNYRAILFDPSGVSVNAQTGTSYTYLSGDRGKLVTHSNGSAIAGTLPQATGAWGAGWFMWVENRGAGTLTITPTTSTIDGASSLALTTNQGCLIASDGTNYYTMRGVGGSGSGATELKGLTFTSDTSSQTDSDPGNGVFRWNNATQGSATTLFFDNQTADGVSTSTFWAALGPSGLIYLQQSDDSTKWQLWKWTATPVNGTGYYKFTVTLMANGGSIGNSKTVLCEFYGLTATAAADLQGTGSDASAAGFRGIPLNSQSTAYTTVMADNGKCIFHPASDTNARTFTIDSNANVAYPIGAAIMFDNETGAGVITIAITSDTLEFVGLGTTGSRTLAAGGRAVAYKITSTKWRISGVSLT